MLERLQKNTIDLHCSCIVNAILVLLVICIFVISIKNLFKIYIYSTYDLLILALLFLVSWRCCVEENQIRSESEMCVLGKGRSGNSCRQLFLVVV